MSDLVSPDRIEQLVGAHRHPTEHIGRAVSAEQTVYILHSAECRDSGIDLRDCPYSQALDRGIEHFYPWSGWRRLLDVPVTLEIARGFLRPDPPLVQAALAGHPEEYHRGVIHPIPIRGCDLCPTRQEGS